MEPGSGWPGDPARSTTPVARSVADVARLASSAATLAHLDARVSVCRACPRLVAWREQVAVERRAAYAGERYWGRPVPSFGDPRARVVVVGLAPAAHGGNRTGRIFTGDRSGDWLFAALAGAGLARSPTSVRAGDGQELVRTRLLAAVRCAPPANKPTPPERDACRGWLVREFELLSSSARVVVALGGFAWTALWPALRQAGYPVPSGLPPFAHGAEVELIAEAGSPIATTNLWGRGHPAALRVLGCYHPSQQNTFTGRLTRGMLDDVFRRAVQLAGLPRPRGAEALGSPVAPG